MAKTTTPFEIVEYVENANLREVSWNETFLETVRVSHSLKHRTAVLFVNKAQDRFRLVANFFGVSVLILPPIDPADRTSLYLKISRYLKKFSSRFASGVKFLDAQIETSQERIRRRAVAARRAQDRRNDRRNVKGES